jgi:hypothetical protein
MLPMVTISYINFFKSSLHNIILPGVLLVLISNIVWTDFYLQEKISILLGNKPLPKKMDLTPSINSSFLELFHNDMECEIENTHSKLNLRVLKIENNQFCYSALVSELSNAIISFSLSRKEFQDFEKDKRYGEMNAKALSRLRDYKVNDGEAGEILLFCFLESHLRAPKILTKLELKTSSNDYVKGSDGIHLLRVNKNQFQLIFGESKLEPSLTDSLSSAFKSIFDFVNRDKNGIDYEMGLINSQLCKEALSEEVYQFIKTIIYPSANSLEPIQKDNAFAIFAGFEITVSEDERKIKNEEFRNLIRTRIKEEVERKKAHIAKKISEYKLFNYTFYLYIFPFMELDKTRKKIIEDLTHPAK